MELMEVFTAEGALFFALVRVKETSAVKTSEKLGGLKEESASLRYLPTNCTGCEFRNCQHKPAVASPIVKLSVLAKLSALFLALR